LSVTELRIMKKRPDKSCPMLKRMRILRAGAGLSVCEKEPAMKKHKPAAVALIIFLIAIALASGEAAGTAADAGDLCLALYIACLADAAVITVTAGPAYLLEFSDFLPACAAGYIFCRICH
jgi:hypothetical protein